VTDNKPRALAVRLLEILATDRDLLKRIDNYIKGEHDDPYMPANADSEYRGLARRAVSNWMPLLVSTPAQAMYVDDFRRGNSGGLADAAVAGTAPAVPAAPVRQVEMTHWHNSRLDARQAAVHRGALTFGHSFVVTEKKRGKIKSRGLSALNTSALFEDPANDDVPYAALTVTEWPVEGKVTGEATLWDGKNSYSVTFKDPTDEKSVRVANGRRHGYIECPVTRFAAAVDLEGRTVGVVEPMIALQDRINQTVFDLLVLQTYQSHQVRYATGMAPPIRRDENGDAVLDGQGNPIPLAINHNAKRFLFAEDPDVKFGTLEATPLDGLISSIEGAIRQLAALSQTPPHHVLGQIANLSAEALLAAENALARKVEEFRKQFGESWERVFRVAAYMAGDEAASDDYFGEVLWRDMEQRSLAQSADALGKMREQLGIPAEGLWARVPGVTTNELNHWRNLAAQNPDNVLADSLRRSVPPGDDGALSAAYSE
jgi:hypothetical protein